MLRSYLVFVKAGYLVDFLIFHASNFNPFSQYHRWENPIHLRLTYGFDLLCSVIFWSLIRSISTWIYLFYRPALLHVLQRWGLHGGARNGLVLPSDAHGSLRPLHAGLSAGHDVPQQPTICLAGCPEPSQNYEISTYIRMLSISFTKCMQIARNISSCTCIVVYQVIIKRGYHN